MSFIGQQLLVPHYGGTAKPIADFTADVTTGDAPVTVTFTDLSTNNPTSWDWDWGDGTAHGNTQNPSHNYTAAGTYTVTLTATNAGGSDSEIKTGYITIYETLTLQPDATAGIDAYIGNDFPDANTGTGTGMRVGERAAAAVVYRGLIKFTLTALPADAIIQAATLSLYAITDLSTNARTFRVYRQLRAWVEAQVTWNNYSTGNAWQAAGGFGALDCEQTAIGSRDFTAAETLNEFKNFTLTPVSKAALDLGNGWLIKADTESDDAYIFSTSDDGTAANRPKLVIRYTRPGA